MLFSLAERDHWPRSRDVERDAFGHLGDAGIAGRAAELVHSGRGRDRPGQRMLAAAAAEDQDVHGEAREPWTLAARDQQRAA